MKYKYYLTLLIFILFSVSKISAHEPLYGNGPHVLFKGGFAPEITIQSGFGYLNTAYSLGYGLTKDWTINGGAAFNNLNQNYEYKGFLIKNKYRFYTYFKPGLSILASAIAAIFVPENNKVPKVLNLGITGGQESLRWYWFVDAAYAFKITGNNIKPGNEINYTATIGYRPFEIDYYKPDLVLFIEGIGRYQEKAVQNGSEVTNSGGNYWAIAPTFFLTYKNYALRAGVEFGIASTGSIIKPDNNYKISIEFHI
jgi:hypothetical protein